MMSLQLQNIDPVPAQTVLVAEAAFPKGNHYILLRDKLGTIYDDALFADLFSQRGQPAQAPWQLALVTLMQFAENLRGSGPFRPTSRRCRQEPNRLEIYAGSGTD